MFLKHQLIMFLTLIFSIYMGCYIIGRHFWALLVMFLVVDTCLIARYAFPEVILFLN